MPRRKIKLQCWHAKMQTMFRYFRWSLQEKVLYASLSVSFQSSSRIASRCMLGVAGRPNSGRLWRIEFQFQNPACASALLSALQRRNPRWILCLPSLRQSTMLQSSAPICWHRGGQREGYGEKGEICMVCSQNAVRCKGKDSRNKTGIRLEAIPGANNSISRSIGGEAERPRMGCGTAREDERGKQSELWKEDERRDALKNGRMVGFWWKYERENSQRIHEAKNAGGSIQADSARYSYAIREEEVATEYSQCIGETS